MCFVSIGVLFYEVGVSFYENPYNIHAYAFDPKSASAPKLNVVVSMRGSMRTVCGHVAVRDNSVTDDASQVRSIELWFSWLLWRCSAFLGCLTGRQRECLPDSDEGHTKKR